MHPRVLPSDRCTGAFDHHRARRRSICPSERRRSVRAHEGVGAVYPRGRSVTDVATTTPPTTVRVSARATQFPDTARTPISNANSTKHSNKPPRITRFLMRQ